MSPPPLFLPYLVLTLLNAEAAGPLLQGDVLVVVQVTSVEEAGGAVLHGDEWGTEWGQLGVGQVPAKVTHGQCVVACQQQPPSHERGGALLGAGNSAGQDAAPALLSSLTAVPVPSQCLPLIFTKVKD